MENETSIIDEDNPQKQTDEDLSIEGSMGGPYMVEKILGIYMGKVKLYIFHLNFLIKTRNFTLVEGQACLKFAKHTRITFKICSKLIVYIPKGYADVLVYLWLTLKLVSTIFYQIFISPNDSPLKTMTGVFFIHLKSCFCS